MPIRLNSAKTDRPKILLIDNSLQMTGAFRSALHIADALRKNYDIELVLPRSSSLRDAAVRCGVICHTLPMREIGRSWWKLVLYTPMLAANTISLRLLLARQKVSVLLINDYYNMLGVTTKLAGWRGAIVTFVRLMPFNQHKLLNWVWTTLGLMCSDHLLAVSRSVARQLPNSRKVSILYSPLSLSERHPPRVHDCAHEVQGVTCLYLANYIHGKGQHVALEAFARAIHVDPSLRLRFAGSDMGLKKNRALKANLMQRVRELGLNSAVDVGDYCDDVESYIKECDIVLNFSESESFSQTCLEACFYGRPVIATRCGGPEEIVEDGVSGLLVPVGDAAAMAEAIVALARHPELRANMGNAGRRLVRERFSIEVFQARFARFAMGVNHGQAQC